jgi:hypothetical protein
MRGWGRGAVVVLVVIAGGGIGFDGGQHCRQRLGCQCGHCVGYFSSRVRSSRIRGAGHVIVTFVGFSIIVIVIVIVIARRRRSAGRKEIFRTRYCHVECRALGSFFVFQPLPTVFIVDSFQNHISSHFAPPFAAQVCALLTEATEAGDRASALESGMSPGLSVGKDGGAEKPNDINRYVEQRTSCPTM